ncbi:MAG: phosphatase PAP2 family protein [Pseudomonadales bacterium]
MTMIRVMLVALLLCGLGACVSRTPAPVAEIRPGLLQGYLSPDAYPDSLGLLPPPPAPGSAAQRLDEAVNRTALALQGSARFRLAALDNDLSFPGAAGTFACAVGAPITETATPFLYQLLRRTLVDAGLATYAAKNHYQRKRPFLGNGRPTCIDEAEQQRLVEDGSYPSGHTAIGWAWALILTELAPDRANEILARGYAFGDSRMICNVHWPSDVTAGRAVGAAAVARLHADRTFRADLARAGREIEAARAARLPPQRDCGEEAGALAPGR